MKTSVQSTSENLNLFITWDVSFYGIHWKSKFWFYFIVNMPMCVSDFHNLCHQSETKHDRQGVNVQCSTCEDLERQKQKSFGKLK